MDKLAHGAAWKFAKSNPEFCISFTMVCSSLSRIYRPEWWKWDLLKQSYHLLPVPLLPSSKEVHVHRERDVLHHHQHVRHLVVKIMQLTISMNICSYEELLSFLLKLQCHLESLLRIQENHKITAIPARMRLMWLLRMSLWLKTWRQKFYSCVYLCGSEQGSQS